MKNKLIAGFLSVILFFNMCVENVFASGNVDGDGGDFGHGSYDNGWVVKNSSGGFIFDTEGLRVYVVDRNTGDHIAAYNTIDISNSSVDVNNIRHFNYGTKMEYRNGAPLVWSTSTYATKKPEATIPRIIALGEESSDSRIERLKKWACNANVSAEIFRLLGVSTADMQKGTFLLAVEPIAYFTFKKVQYAMTATEAAMFNTQASDALYNFLRPLTHVNLPASLFLEHSEFTSSSNTMSAWDRIYSINWKNNPYVTDDVIKDRLGIGYFNYGTSESGGNVEELPENNDRIDHIYTEGNWVFTSVIFLNDTSHDIAYNPSTVNFNIPNVINYDVTDIRVPKGKSQRVWIKWKVPSGVGYKRIFVTVKDGEGKLYGSDGSLYKKLTVTVYSNPKTSEIVPPDPQPEVMPKNQDYIKNMVPGAECTSNSWETWDCRFYTDYVDELDKNIEKYFYSAAKETELKSKNYSTWFDLEYISYPVKTTYTYGAKTDKTATFPYTLSKKKELESMGYVVQVFTEKKKKYCYGFRSILYVKDTIITNGSPFFSYDTEKKDEFVKDGYVISEKQETILCAAKKIKVAVLKYKFHQREYKASVILSDTKIKPSRRCPTWFLKNGEYNMKSGYGVEIETIEAKSRVKETYVVVDDMGNKIDTKTDYHYGDTLMGNSFATGVQNIFAYFPEFSFRTYSRQLEKNHGDWIWRKNVYSTFSDPVHFTPLWFPDKTKYFICFMSTDCYTPAGMLYARNISNSIMIDGNVFDDWMQVQVRE